MQTRGPNTSRTRPIPSTPNGLGDKPDRSSQPLTEPTFSAPLLYALLRTLKARDCDSAPLLEQVGLSKRALLGGGRLPHSVASRLMEHAIERTGDPYLGLQVGAHSDPIDHGLYALLCQTATSVDQTLARNHRYARLLHDAIRIWWEVDSDHLSVYYTLEGVPTSRPLNEAVLAAVVTRIRCLLGAAWRPAAVCFTHPAPEGLEPYRGFFRCDLRFGMAANAVVVPIRVLDLGLPGGGSELSDLLEQRADIALSGIGGASFTERVRQILLENVERGRADAETVMESMHVSRSTLERRLRAEGESFRSVLSSLRLELARRYLSHVELTLDDVAGRVGFSDLRSFSRAFKRWTGTTPGSYREPARARH